MDIVRVHCSEVEEDMAIEGVLIYGGEVYREELLELQERGYLVVLVLDGLADLDLSDEELGEYIAQCESLEGFSNSCLRVEDLTDGYVGRIYARWHGIAAIIYESDRIIVRESVVEDAEGFYNLYHDRDVCEYVEAALGDREQSVEGYREYIKAYVEHQYPYYEYGMYSLICKENGKCIGRVGVEYKEDAMHAGLSLGYAILSEYRGNGYVSEACNGIVEDCFEEGFGECIYVYIDEDNHNSRAVAKRLGAEMLSQMRDNEVSVWKLIKNKQIV